MANPIRERLIQLEKTLERLFGGQPAREPLEVRHAVLDALLGQVRPVGGGKRLLPLSRVTVSVVAHDAAERRLFKEALTGEDGLERDLRRELERQGVAWPDGFTLGVRFVKAPGPGWAPGSRFHVAVTPATEAPAAPAAAREASAPAESVADAPRLVLKVTSGEAKPRSAATRGGRLTIGRLVTVSDQQGRVLRRNDVAFVGEDEVSRSVSRAHASVAWQPAARCYRIFDEYSSHGTHVARQGRLVAVPPGRTGLKLQPGDEIHVGRAVIRVDIGD
ncbi:MAG TPA: FHA domain-containing protein [Vicinamibacterales bacterium]